MDFDRVNRRDALAGLAFVALGAFFAWQTTGLDVGTARRMGPGYFPLVAAGLLALLGLIVLGGALRAGAGPVGTLAWRGMAFLLSAPVVFGLTVRGAGLVPALLAASLLAALASPRLGLPRALLVAAAVTAFCTLLFSYGLGLPIPRVGPWFAAPPPA